MDAERSLKVTTYRNRAEELRVIAKGFRNEDCEQTLLKIAADYDAMAEDLMKPETQEVTR